MHLLRSREGFSGCFYRVWYVCRKSCPRVGLYHVAASAVLGSRESWRLICADLEVSSLKRSSLLTCRRVRLAPRGSEVKWNKTSNCFWSFFLAAAFFVLCFFVFLLGCCGFVLVRSVLARMWTDLDTDYGKRSLEHYCTSFSSKERSKGANGCTTAMVYKAPSANQRVPTHTACRVRTFV